MDEKIFILLPVHSRRQTTEDFIQCLKSQVYNNYHLVLIDDGSTDGTAETVRNHIKNLTVLIGKGDWWWAGSLQQGINWLKKVKPDKRDIVLFINDDVTFDSHFLKNALEILRKKPNTLLLPQSLDMQTGHPVESGIEADLTKLTFRKALAPEKINCLSTRGLFVRWSDLLKIGDFRPFILPHYLSDYEFTIRAHKKRFALCTHPELILLSQGHTSGYREFKKMRFGEFIRSYFSKQSAVNPLYWTVFTILVSPKTAILMNIVRIWKSALGTLLKHLLPVHADNQANS
ncbi:MAG: glycosyltransferase family 2 protein [Nitrospirae bacterium]|nr:glycosyltransferase family 2 protein [Nitrospirota bacterium]